MDKINSAAANRRNEMSLQRLITTAGYTIGALLILVSAGSYILTRIVITAQTDTSLFNEEYARLRILSLPFTTLPLLIGLVGIIMFLLTKTEKLTGLDQDELLKKKN